MYPTICYIGPVPLRSFGLLLAMAILTCYIFLKSDAKEQGIESHIILDLIFATVVGGLIGARLFFVLLNYSYFLENPLEIFFVAQGGLAWQGGLILGCLSGVWFVKRKHLKLSLILDLVAPYLALGQAIGRIGCFLNGCCHGRAVSWGIYFPNFDAHLHPTQLYSSGGLFVIFLLLKGYQKNTPFAGGVFVLYLILAAFWRIIVEFFRADHYVLFLGLSVFQWVCLSIIIVAFLIRKQMKKI